MSYTSANTTQTLQKATDWNAPKVGNLSEKTQHVWHHSSSRRHISLYVKFETRLTIPFTSKFMSQKSGPFSMGIAVLFRTSEF
jgi:hypothetical protein